VTSTNGDEVRSGLFVSLGNFFFFHRNWMFAVVMLGLVIAYRPVYPLGSESLDRWLDVLGIAVILGGQALRAIVIGLAYIVRGGKDGKVYAEGLVTTGFFSHCRNPLYVGNMMVFFGLFIVFNNPLVYLIGVPFVLLVYAAITAAEEAYLRGRFGQEYEDYCGRVRRWLPTLRGLRQTVRGMTFSWARVVIREYGSTYAWTSWLLFLLGYERLAHSTYKQEQAPLVLLLAAWILATVAWLAIGQLKRSHRLVAD